MIKKRSYLAAILAIIFSLVVWPLGAVSAEIADGTYEVEYEIKETENGNTSIANGYFVSPAKLIVEEGVQSVKLTITSSEWIQSLNVPSGEVEVVSEDNENNTRVVKFKVEDISKPVPLGIHVVVPEEIAGMSYDNEHTARAVFDVSELSSSDNEAATLNDTDQVADESQASEEKAAQQSSIKLADGLYTIDASYISAKDGSASAMGRYLDEAIIVSAKDNELSLTITINSDETVTKLQVNGINSVEKIVDGEKRHETFELTDLASVLDAYVEYQAAYQGGVHEGQAEFLISLDEQSVNQAETPAVENTGSTENADNDQSLESNEGAEVQNPQTGDTNHLLLYTLLAAGSLILLIVILKRRLSIDEK